MNKDSRATDINKKATFENLDFSGFSPLALKVYETLTFVPRGKVVTYGMLAALSGCPMGARAVGNILHRNPYPDLIPCFRVVNKEGRVSENFGFGGGDEQIRRLERDGIKVQDRKVDLTEYLWRITDESL